MTLPQPKLQLRAKGKGVMSGTEDERSPRFELVRFSVVPDNHAAWSHEFTVEGIPKTFFRLYRAADSLTLLTDRRYGQLVRFGTVGLDGNMCLDSATGKVVEIIPAPGKEGPAWLVNSSLMQFRECVKRVIDRFPFYGPSDRESDDSEQAALAASELIDMIEEVDPPAIAEQYGFWQTFASDVEMGDFSIEEILRDRH